MGHAPGHVSSDLLLWHVCILEACTLSFSHMQPSNSVIASSRKCSRECVVLCMCAHAYLSVYTDSQVTSRLDKRPEGRESRGEVVRR